MIFGRGVVGGVLGGGIALAVIVVGGCSDTSGAPSTEVLLPDAGVDALPEVGAADTGRQPVLACTPSPRTSENLNPRVDVTRPTAAVRTVKTSDLFARFVTNCGQCHVSTSNGGFQATAQTFPMIFDEAHLARIESEDPSYAMPPVGKAFSSRGPDDPVRQLATYLEAWIVQGRPDDMFTLESSTATAAGAGAPTYAYTAMTNLGDCVPAKETYASSPSGEMDSKDTFFANATTLPNDLTETDLTTLDTATLAANGVIAFRPTYPLWSDGSGKLRFVRVPKGTSMKFDKTTQTFDIPTNTRFYKTFLRRVVDKTGNISYRKVETRLIVSRPDTLDADGNTVTYNSLFGTYVWSDDEMSATLLTASYRDGTGFADRTSEYIADEVVYQDVIDNIPPGTGTLASKLQATLSDPKYIGLVQHYAIPGSLRCTQCHQGSLTRNFVLGFNPLQIAQRAANAGGVYEPVGADELNQLQRLIDYGVISGMDSPADVLPLEDSQLPRVARTPEELTAQAYMMGNCAHCHNPHGYPSIAKPDLKTALNFLPRSAPDVQDATAPCGRTVAGIFEFCFERMSPVRGRGANQDVPFPYITPSLRDYPVADTDMLRVDNGAPLISNSGSPLPYEFTWSPKYNPEMEDISLGAQGCSTALTATDRAYCHDRKTGHSFVAAPWRSLIYRNVDTPFPYFDDYVPFPHMPLNTAGFDCRAPRIMGSWMVGLPAVLKTPYRGVSEDGLPGHRRADGTYPPALDADAHPVLRDGIPVPTFIDAAQPYQEVKPDDPGYVAAQAAAHVRLTEYQTGIRYNYCQDVLSPDIFDPIPPTIAQTSTAHLSNTYYPVPDRYLYAKGGYPVSDPKHPGDFVQPQIGVPYHAEWFNYDPTDAPPPWQPRRGPVWEDILVHDIPDIAPGPNRTDPINYTKQPLEPEAALRLRTIRALHEATLTPALRAYATTDIPYGLWLAKDACKDQLASAAIPKVSDPRFAPNTGADRPPWMDVVPASSLPPDAPVYMMSPGASLFRHICINCHGPKADGHGLQGDALSAASEGQARPANLGEGLFGPDVTHENLIRTFGIGTGSQAVADLWGSRYMAWMTLGGTLQLIPRDVINQVQATKIFGASRPHLSKLPPMDAGAANSANMLNLAKLLCAVVLPDIADPTNGGVGFYMKDTATLDANGKVVESDSRPYFLPLKTESLSPFLTGNGDYEMWMHLCSTFNRQVVRVYRVQRDRYSQDNGIMAQLSAFYYTDDGTDNPPYRFPSNGHVWDQNRVERTNGVTPDNYYPVCLKNPDDLLPGEGPSESSYTATSSTDPRYLAFRQAASNMPVCPSEFINHHELIMWTDINPTDEQVENMRRWSLRGAINAGMSVFSYLEKADLAHNTIQPYYNECQLLPPPPMAPGSP